MANKSILISKEGLKFFYALVNKIGANDILEVRKINKVFDCIEDQVEEYKKESQKLYDEGLKINDSEIEKLEKLEKIEKINEELRKIGEIVINIKMEQEHLNFAKVELEKLIKIGYKNKKGELEKFKSRVDIKLLNEIFVAIEEGKLDK